MKTMEQTITEEMKMWEIEMGLNIPTEQEMEEMAKYFLKDE